MGKSAIGMRKLRNVVRIAGKIRKIVHILPATIGRSEPN